MTDLKDKEVPIKFLIKNQLNSNVPRIFSNLVQVRHNPHEFNLLFTEITPMEAEEINDYYNNESKEIELPLEPKCVIIVTPVIIEGLIDALTKNYNSWKENQNKLTDNNEITKTKKRN